MGTRITPSKKKTHESFKRIDDALEAKPTTYLSDEFKEHLNKVLGQNKARETFIGRQAGALRGLNNKRNTVE